MREQQQEQNDDFDFRQAVNFTFTIAKSHAVCLTPFLRNNFGTNQPGICGLFGFILMFATSALSGDLRMLGYMAAWVCAMFVQRAYAFAKRRRGWQIHSYFDGHPWAGHLVPFCRTEHMAKAGGETMICLFAGLALAPWSPAIGLFVLTGVLSLGIVNGMQAEVRKRRVTAMRDLQIEQRTLSERLRGVRSDF